ncbi:MAG: hypothetical protein ACFCGT_00810 [Sandaracinaceae bacterium]
MKPPGAPPPGPPAAEGSEAAPTEPVAEPTGPERAQGAALSPDTQRMDAAGAVDPSDQTDAGRDALHAVLEAGRIGADEAMDRLVARAMTGTDGLPAAERSALEGALRDALSTDPTLLALRRDLGRGPMSG